MTAAEENKSRLVSGWLAGDGDDEMYDVCTEEPELAWLVILQLVEHQLTEDHEALLAAGPMEDLLVWHGPTFIERVEVEAASNSRFNHLLGGVWRREMDLNVWSRIEQARKKVW